ncbi:MAG TPA: DUF4982 domain-containing protein [Phycisphaerae bacterium]|jgi:beta-galactosidase|nr:DUF4982 domain-containing protein [Phycisphaerae bacterium]
MGLLFLLGNRALAQAIYVPPASAHEDYNFDMGWKFIKEESAKIGDGMAPDFNDAAWQNVTLPHSYNDIDSFRDLISHSGGDRGTYKGYVWYRKHFQLPAGSVGKHVFLEFEGMRQAADIFLNGKQVGLYENGVSPYGVDITSGLNFSGDNVLALHLTNSTGYIEKSSGIGFRWNANDFNPAHGGINRHVLLHLTGPIYQTLPLYYGLQSTGIYIHPGNFNIAGKSCDVTVESEVHNSSVDRATVQLATTIVDAEGKVCAKFDADPLDMVATEKSVITGRGALQNAHWWSPDDPYLYSVYTTLSVEGKVVDVRKTVTGFRKTEFKGGAGTGGVYINDKFVYLKGYSQRSANDWAGIGNGYPDWMHDYTLKLLRDSHGNYIRWMHVTPMPSDASSCDRLGIVQMVPAGDKEAPPDAKQFVQRFAAMTYAMVYFRNSPSNFFWEAGNTILTPEQMAQMVELRKKLDPDGGRVMGTRDNDQAAANTALTPILEYYGVMIGQAAQTDRITGNDIFRGYSIPRRDRAPLIETEDYREEAGRRFWDDFSPPYFGFKKGANDTWNLNSETFAIGSVRRYASYLDNIISNPDPAHSKWSGYCSIYFTDEDADGRQQSSEVARASGKVDGMRLPKEIYYAHRVIQSETPDLHIIGHWTYPADTKKTMYVISNTKSVDLLLNGKSLGKNTAPTDGFVFAFPNVAFQPGSLVAVGYDAASKEVARQELQTAGPAKSLKLTLTTAPGGMLADGTDVALIDFEVVDAQGRRCPTDDARVDFTCTGPANWRGGYNSGKPNSTNNLYLNTECGINRVALRSTTTPGKITVTAKRDGLESASVEIETKPVTVTNGLAKIAPVYLPLK